MRNATHKALTATLIAAALAVAGCKSTPSTPAANPVQTQPATPNSTAAGAPNSTLNSDGTTSTPTAAPAPAPAQQASARQPEPVRPAVQPTPLPPPPPPPSLVAPVGTRVVIRTTETLSASHNEVGDVFTGVLAEPMVVRAATIYPTGTRISGAVVASKHRGRFKGAGDLGIQVTTIGGSHVQTTEYEQAANGKGKRTGTLIGGGAGLGALIGGLAGGGKGAVIGGLAGAGAGTAGAAYTGNKDVVIPSESLVTVSLTAPLTVERRSAR